MSDSKIFEGKTTNEAIEKGLKELKVSRNDVNIKVLEEDKKSFFNILTPRVVKIEITLKEGRGKNNYYNEKQKEIVIDEKIVKKASEKIKEFLDKFFEQSIGKKADYEICIDNSIIKVNIKDEKADFLIGYRGETLNSMQILLATIATNDAGEKIKVEMDALGYREKRQKALEELAEKVAKSVIRTRKSITLEPMIPYERKIIHMKLQDNKRIKTESVGMGTHRKVVISLK